MTTSLNVLIAVDQTDMADLILKRSLELLPANANIFLVHVIDKATTLGQGVINSERIFQSDQKEAECFLNELLAKYPLDQKFKSFHKVIVSGNPSDQLAQIFADKEHIDYLVIGKTTNRGLLDKIFIGSTAKRIIEETKHNIILIQN